MTLKFLPRTPAGKAELKINTYIHENSRSPYLAILRDSFEIPHHMASTSSEHKDLKFSAIAYEVTRRDLRRCFQEWPQPLSLSQKKQCVRDLVQGLAELHRLSIVHGDVHPGNVALPAPSTAMISDVLTAPPDMIELRRKDGTPTHPTLPQRVTEPIDIGFGEGDTKLFDFGFAFVAHHNVSYAKGAFATGTPRPPELVPQAATTTRPFLVDSWHLGLTVYFIATNGASFVDELKGEEKQLKHIHEQFAQLKAGRDERIEELPVGFKDQVKRILISLLQPEPLHRFFVTDLARDKWLVAQETKSC